MKPIIVKLVKKIKDGKVIYVIILGCFIGLIFYGYTIVENLKIIDHRLQALQDSVDVIYGWDAQFDEE